MAKELLYPVLGGFMKRSLLSVLLIVGVLAGASAKAVSLGEARTYQEFYFSFTEDTESEAIFSVSSQDNQTPIELFRPAQDLVIVRVKDVPAVISFPGEPRDAISFPGGSGTVTIPQNVGFSFIHNGQVPVYRMLVSQGLDLRLSEVRTRVTFPRPPVIAFPR